MKTTLKVLAVLGLIASMIFVCCGCSERKEEKSMSEVFELSDPNEHIVDEDMWYESYCVYPDGKMGYRGSVDKERVDEWVIEKLSSGCSIYGYSEEVRK